MIADMMEKEPRLRIQTAAEVVARLEPWAANPGPMPSQQMTRSPWMPPPVTGESDPAAEEADELDDTNPGSWGVPELDDPNSDVSSQASQATDAVAADQQDTQKSSGGHGILRHARAVPPPIPQLDPLPSDSTSSRNVAIALAVAVPISSLECPFPRRAWRY